MKFLAILLFAVSALAQSVNSASYTGTDAGQQITNAIAALGGNGTVVANYAYAQSLATCPTWGNAKLTIELWPTQYNVLANCVVPVNVAIKPWNGALLAPASGVKVTVNGDVVANPGQQIVNIANGNVLFTHVPAVWWSWYGAGGSDSSPGIQAGINAMALINNGFQKPPFRCVPGIYYPVHSKPIHVNVSNFVIGGPGSGGQACGIQSNYGFGPNLVIGPGPSQAYCGNGAFTCPQSTPLAPGLTTSGGSALVLDGVHPYWFNLSLDTKEFNALNGLTQLTLEAFVNVQTLGTGVIMGSSGSLTHSYGVTQAFQLYFVGSTLTCSINTSNGLVRLNGVPAISAGVTNHVACSWDGTTARLFVAGNEVASAPATGTLVQGVTINGQNFAAEDVTIGPALQTWPDAGVLTQSCKCTIDSPRISNIARYTSDAGFAPPAGKLTSDSNTLGLMNFGNCFDVFCDFQSKDANGFLFLRNATFVGALVNVEVQNMLIASDGIGGGIYTYQTTQWAQNDVQVTTDSAVNDYFWNNSFIGSAKTLYINNGGSGNGFLGHGTIGLGMTGAIGIINLTDVHITGGRFGVVANGGSFDAHTLHIAPNTEMLVGVFAKGSGGSERLDVSHLTCDAEISTPNAYQACLFTSQMRGTYTGGEPEGMHYPPVWIDGGDSITFIGQHFLQTAADGYSGPVFNVITAPSQPITVINAVQALPFASWSNKPNTVQTPQMNIVP